MADLSILLSEGFQRISVRLVTDAIKAGFRALSSSGGGTSLDFDPHLRRTFDRCTKVRTLVHRDKSIDLLAQYVNLKFRCDDEVIDDYTLIERLPKLRHLIVAGTGGGGKTMFTRYLWISLFVRPPGGRIPIYIELRRLNDLTTDNLFAYIFHSAFTEKQSSEAREMFDRAMSEGRFALILDGFDEVQEDQKSSIEKQILELSHFHPENIVVVSGRPDERFSSWQSFKIYKVEPLVQDQVIDLISRIDFDKTTKKKFIERIRKDLYKKHKSFLSTPLLATMMLLTFDSYADIPEKVHVFYDQAFNTLLLRHDAIKENFKRGTRTNLSVDLFQAHLASFCLLTYLKQKYEFTEEEIIAELDLAKKMSQVDVNSRDFYRDLRDSVCLVAMDGNRVVFTHRSFQEYFSALCTSRLPTAKAGIVLKQLASRVNDQTFHMLFDMNRDRVEESYFLPMLGEFEPIANRHNENFDLEHYLRSAGVQALLVRTLRKLQNARTMSLRPGWAMVFRDQPNSPGYQSLLLRIRECYPETRMDDPVDWRREHDKRWKRQGKFPLADRLLQESKVRQGDDARSIGYIEGVEVFGGGQWLVAEADGLSISKWFETTVESVWYKHRLKSAIACRQKILRQQNERGESLDKVLETLVGQP